MDNVKLSDILKDIDTEYTEIDLYNEQKKQKKLQKRLDKNKNKVQNKKKRGGKKKMKKLKIVKKTKFYKTMLVISAYINFLLILGIMGATGLLSKILDYIFVIY